MGQGRRSRAGGVTILHARGVAGERRVGFIAGRRIGGAVARNRAKRRLREAAARVELAEGVDYIIIASDTVLDADFEQLVGWLSAGSIGGKES